MGFDRLSPNGTGIDPVLVDRFTRDILALTGALAPDARLGVAVSGGPDSMALLFLAHAAMPGRIEAATVDHGLRPENRGEAEMVGAVCARLELPHRVLGPMALQAPHLGVQGWARTVRYDLLSSWCASARLVGFMTAHHRDDQAESLLMRAVRGSGLAGLIGAWPVQEGVRLLPWGGKALRPLLRWSRAELAAIVLGAGVTPVDDPSNRDPAYDRTRVRALLARETTLDAAGLARTSENLRDADDAVEWAVARTWAERVTEEPGEVLAVNAAGLPREIKRRIVAEVIRRFQFRNEISGSARGSQVAALVDALGQGETRTLGGVWAHGGDPWRFSLAPPRRA